MLRALTLLIITVTLLVGCTNNEKRNKKAQAGNVKPLVAPLTDSAKLLRHLDSLPKAILPLNVSDWNRSTPSINLVEFKNKKLFRLLYKRIPRIIGGAGIDMMTNDDSTFNLCDTNYKANWVLISKTPKFFVVEVDTNYLLLVTIDYQLNVIDAVHIAAGDPTSNKRFQGELSSTIHKNLKITMHYTYYVQVDEEGHFDTTTENDIWRINNNGIFKPIRYTKAE